MVHNQDSCIMVLNHFHSHFIQRTQQKKSFPPLVHNLHYIQKGSAHRYITFNSTVWYTTRALVFWYPTVVFSIYSILPSHKRVQMLNLGTLSSQDQQPKNNYHFQPTRVLFCSCRISIWVHNPPMTS